MSGAFRTNGSNRQARLAHPLQVLAYAAKHGYDDVADQAALPSLALSVDDAVRTLPPAAFVSWVCTQLPHEYTLTDLEPSTFGFKVRYREAWTLALRSFAQKNLRGVNDQNHWMNNIYVNGVAQCSLWDSLRPQVIGDIVDGVHRFCDFHAWKASRLPACYVCAERLQPLITKIESLPSFSDLSLNDA